jgi:hypothetical protein
MSGDKPAVRDGETLDQERERAWLMVQDYVGRPMWWQRKFLTKQYRWLVSYFEYWTSPPPRE